MAVLVGKEAPDFTEDAAVGQSIEKISLSQYKGKKYVVLFFYPLDFTFVCPTEIHAFQEALKEIESHDAVLLGCSVDSAHSHMAWLRTPKNDGGIQGVTFPIIGDISKRVARAYDVLDEEGAGITYRASFVIDKKGVVQAQIVHHRPIGRNVDEVIRLLDALQFSEEHGEVCPVNWRKGDKGMKESREGVKEYLGEKK
jgi:peroxiredoxin (alkyl hydroperoxide reductase subunit C)